ncbi:MAG: UDP-N-acetylmuramate--L-alanine ligase [Clostridia bacterium]|nr:UDP-N-acetylmuramate--L-alanine ligase [Clostridia bacterium]
MFSNKQSWYFIGIGGVSMSALAQLLHSRGANVSGSDAVESSFTQKLVSLGIPVSIGDNGYIYADNVVYTGAIEENQKQLKAAREAGKRLLSRAELLGMVAEEYPHTISVAGCHGKTSTTSMLSHIFASGNRAFACHIGGEDLDFGNYYSTGGEYFITEACEFRRSFLSLNSEIAVILNTDRDHTDCYASEAELVEAYRLFANHAQKVVVNADDIHARNFTHALSFGLHAGDIQAENLQSEGEKYTFTVTEHGIPVERISLKTVGKYQICNALAAFAAARLAGFTPSEIKCGLENFHGVKRRFEEVGYIHGVPMICDYAHHPREILASFSSAQRLCRGTVRLVFQPHTFTRTRDLMSEFVSVLKKAENPLIYKTYAAREKFDFKGSAVALVSRLPEASYVQSPEDLRVRLEQEVEAGDLVLVLGAGDIYDIAKSICD